MRNIFKTFKENKKLLEENRVLSSQITALTEFKKSFDDYYQSISSHRIIEKRYGNTVVVSGALKLDDLSMHCPQDECKRRVVNEIAQQLEPYVEFDLVDDRYYGTKTYVGRLMVLQGE